MISIIVAIAENNAIGKDNNLLFYLSEDLKRFKRLTTGHHVIMGKKTFESLPNGPLPNRTNVVITDIPDENIEGCVMAYSIEDAVEKSKDDNESFIIGGGMIYKQFLPLADRLYLTLVHEKFDADVYFPEINYDDWTEINREEHPKDENNPHHYSYLILERRK